MCISSCIFFSMGIWGFIFKEEWERLGTSLRYSIGDRDIENELNERWTTDLRNTWKDVLELSLEPNHVIAGCNTTWVSEFT